LLGAVVSYRRSCGAKQYVGGIDAHALREVLKTFTDFEPKTDTGAHQARSSE
jgi:hypothetical protein